MHKEKGSGRAFGLDPFFKYGLYFYFLLYFYFTILILYTNDFNPRINKDIIIIIIIIIIITIIIIIIIIITIITWLSAFQIFSSSTVTFVMGKTVADVVSITFGSVTCFSWHRRVC